MQPFFNRTRASIMSWPTMNWRCKSAFRFSRSIVCQGMYWNSALVATAFVALVRGLRVRALVLPREEPLDLSFFFAITSPSGLVDLTFIQLHSVVVQISMGERQGSRFGDFSLGNHLRQSRGQLGAGRFCSQPIALFRAQDSIVWEEVGPEGDLLGESFQPHF